ncbi:hypothetical protein ACFT2C_02930 [Promicromonospora sp. NPDC057138]|uniref:hypothetical protein n=1 Tax=Promicromonospora sp. NPDC057138 TaxID=3346031 RepID=UPI003641652F
MPIGLIALALGGFGVGLTEFGIVGLLPELVAAFGATESVAGHLVSGYAVAFAVGVIAIAAAYGFVSALRVGASLIAGDLAVLLVGTAAMRGTSAVVSGSAGRSPPPR